MIDNKVLITLYVPYLDKEYDLYIPVNKRVHVIIDLMKRALFELSEGNFDISSSYELINYEDGSLYDMNMLVRDTGIQNSSKVILI